VTNVISDLESILGHKAGFENLFVYKEIAKHNKKELVESIALRFLIHYVGDIHQPLHVGARYNNQFKKGDRGGNSLRLKN
jgi:hypothetical protein